MTQPIITDDMIAAAMVEMYGPDYSETYNHIDHPGTLGQLRGIVKFALESALKHMPPIKLLKAKYKTSEEIEAQQYSDYWRGVCDGIDSAKASIESAGLRWVE